MPATPGQQSPWTRSTTLTASRPGSHPTDAQLHRGYTRLAAVKGALHRRAHRRFRSGAARARALFSHRRLGRSPGIRQARHNPKVRVVEHLEARPDNLEQSKRHQRSIRRLHAFGFDGPSSGTRHQFMTYHGNRLAIPSNTEYSVPQLRMMIWEVESIIGRTISLAEWRS